jgi:hypothetical protein
MSAFHDYLLECGHVEVLKDGTKTAWCPKCIKDRKVRRKVEEPGC